MTHGGNEGYFATIRSASGLACVASASLHCAMRGRTLCLYEVFTVLYRSWTRVLPAPYQPPNLAETNFQTSFESWPRCPSRCCCLFQYSFEYAAFSSSRLSRSGFKPRIDASCSRRRLPASRKFLIKSTTLSLPLSHLALSSSTLSTTLP